MEPNHLSIRGIIHTAMSILASIAGFVAAPFASGPDDPRIQKCLMGILTIYIIGVIYQIIKLRAGRKTPPHIR